MTNYKGRQEMVQIENYTTGATETSKVFTIPADDFTNTSEYVLYISGRTTAALILQMRINTLATSVYYTDGVETIGGTSTVIDSSAADHAILASAALLDANRTVHGIVHIVLNKASQNRVSITSSISSPTKLGNYIATSALSDEITSLTSIEVLVSTSSLVIGTNMTLYRVRKH